MGIQQVEVPAEKVVIHGKDTHLVITNPQVLKVNMMGQETFQITGEIHEETEDLFSAEDIAMVMEKAGVSEEEATRALTETQGDIAEAIVFLADD